MTAGACITCVSKKVLDYVRVGTCYKVRVCVQGADAEALVGKKWHSLPYALFPFIHPSIQKRLKDKIISVLQSSLEHCYLRSGYFLLN